MGKQSTFFIVFLPPTPTLDPTGLRFLGLTAGGRLTINGFFFFTFWTVAPAIVVVVVCVSVGDVFIIDGGGLRWRRTDGDATVFAGTAAMTLSTLISQQFFQRKINTHRSKSMLKVLTEMCGWRQWRRCLVAIEAKNNGAHMRIQKNSKEEQEKVSLSFSTFAGLVPSSIGSFWLFPSFTLLW